MSIPIGVCVGALLAVLVASDTSLRWPGNRWKTSPKSTTSNAKSDIQSTATKSYSAYARVAAYIALASLVLPWSSHPLGGSFVAQPAFPSQSWRAEAGSTEEAPNNGLSQGGQTETSQDELFEQAIRNETLGFEKIFVVNLPERADKRDALSLVSALTNIKLTWTSAVRGTDVPDKALPLGVDRKGWRDGGIGSWRSQMNIMRRMVEENIATALILEDDADWDTRLKSQLASIAEGTRILLSRAHAEPAFSDPVSSTPAQRALDNATTSSSPYGTGWDLLWLGHCGETFPERIPGHEHIYDRSSTRYTYYAIQDDETLPARVSATESWIAGDLARDGTKGTRWVHFSGGPTCSQAYALSQSGARKVLLALSVGGTLVEQLDNAMSLLCRDYTPWDHGGEGGDGQGEGEGEGEGETSKRTPPGPGYKGANMRCLSVNPAVFSQHKPRGRRAAASDIETVEDGEEEREEGESPNLVWSARLNVQNLMMGRPMEEQRVKFREDGVGEK